MVAIPNPGSEKDFNDIQENKFVQPTDPVLQEKVIDVHDQLQNSVESAAEEPPFSEQVLEIAMRLDNEEISETETVIELISLLNSHKLQHKLPITKKLLTQIGVKNFTLGFEDVMELHAFDIISNDKKWITIEDCQLKEGSDLFFDTEQHLGNEVIGTLVMDAEKGFCFSIPDHPPYPIDTTVLSHLVTHGGASAFIGKKIIAQVAVSNTLCIERIKPVE